MAEMIERKFGCACPPPHPCNHQHELSMAEWMQYINTYIDVRARQMYDKLKGLYQGGSGEVNKIEGIEVNGVPQTIVNKVAQIKVTIPDVPETSKDLSYSGGTTTTFSKIEQISTSVGDLKDTVDQVNNDINVVKNNVSTLQTDVLENTDSIGKIQVTLSDHIFDDSDDDYFILRDKNNPEKKYKVFIVDGTICSDEIE